MALPVFPQEFPTLETQRLILRQIEPEDVDAIFRNFSNPEIARWFFEEPLQRMEQAEMFLEAFAEEFAQGQGITWAVTLKETETCIGTCGYGDLEIGQRAELGFDLAKEYWGQGLMAEALGAMLAYGLEAFNLGVVEAHTYMSNARAVRLLEKLGFRLQYVKGDSSYFTLLQASRP